MPAIAVDTAGAIVSSAVVAAIVSGLISFLTQRYLLARKAQIDYEFLARKRLYEVIGPLRMQLLLAARDVVRRSRSHADVRWNMDVSDHYARSFIYRLLRPLAIGQLIERQMSVADFSVDPAAVSLLRFNAAAERMLAGNDIVLNHPHTDWSTQSQHLFRDNLRVAAARLIVEEDEGDVVLDYARFQREVPDFETDPALRELALIFKGCKENLTENPLFWLRVVGYSYACNHLVATQGTSVGFQDLPLDVEAMVHAAEDEVLRLRAPEYVQVFDSINAQGL